MNGCNFCGGAIGIYYLKPDGASFKVTKAWPTAIKGWTRGLPPDDFVLTGKFTRFPGIYAEGGGKSGGYECDTASLTELRPEGPVESAPINISFSNVDAADPDTDRPGYVGDRPARDIRGTIVNIVRDKSFEVRVTGAGAGAGAERFTERYVRRGNRFVRTTETSRLSC